MIEIARSPLQRSARVLETAEGAELNRRNTPSLPFGPRALPSLLVPVLCSFRQNANLVYLLPSRDRIGLTN
jgi:hypothetical protein